MYLLNTENLIRSESCLVEGGYPGWCDEMSQLNRSITQLVMGNRFLKSEYYSYRESWVKKLMVCEE